MSDKTPPPPAPPDQKSALHNKKQGPIADMRAQFARKTPQTPEERARARAFIAGKIDMVRADTTMTGADKAAAIAELEQALARV
jgi:hypothetical protein